jgi:DNA-binding NtrC family response regulator
MKLGATDYLIKDARPQEILLAIDRVLKLDALQRENVRLREEVGRLHGFGELIGESAVMKESTASSTRSPRTRAPCW